MALDRGKNDIFHGRQKEIKQFEFFKNQLEKENSRTSFLIQGPPGAGKTTLSEKCYELAQQQGWRVVRVDIADLLDLKRFRQRLGREPFWKFWEKRKIEFPLGVDSVSVKIKIDFDRQTLIKTLNAVSKPTIVGLDEAQTLGSNRLSREAQHTLETVLDQLHNVRGKAKNPIIFFMNGLGRTRDIVFEYGISRFASKSIIALESLDQKAERQILRDWMIQKAGLSPNQSNFHHWLDEISQQTHQWPVHIASYGMELVEYIEKQGKTLNEEGLQIVLENGLKAKETYYDHRTRVWPKEVCESFASFLSPNETNFIFSCISYPSF